MVDDKNDPKWEIVTVDALEQKSYWTASSWNLEHGTNTQPTQAHAAGTKCAARNKPHFDKVPHRTQKPVSLAAKRAPLIAISSCAFAQASHVSSSIVAENAMAFRSGSRTTHTHMMKKADERKADGGTTHLEKLLAQRGQIFNLH